MNGITFADGVRTIAEFDAESLMAAEDVALRIGRLSGLLLSVQTGSPLEPPRLTQIAECSEAGGLLKQWNYFYTGLPRMSEAPFELGTYAALAIRVLGLEPDLRRRIELATRWFAVAAGNQSAVDKYMAAWIGLEGLSPILHERWHNMSRCSVCKPPKGKKPRPHNDGAEHLMRLVAPELIQARTFKGLVDLRDRLAHADPTDPNLDEELARQIAPDVMLCLGTAILSAIEPQGQLTGALPRDISIQPTERALLQFDRAQASYRPFMGGWIPCTRHVVEVRTWHDDEGIPRRGERPAIEYTGVRAPRGIRPIATQSITHFVPEGMALDLEPAPGEFVDVWRPLEQSPAIKRTWIQFGPEPKGPHPTSGDPIPAQWERN